MGAYAINQLIVSTLNQGYTILFLRAIDGNWQIQVRHAIVIGVE